MRLCRIRHLILWAQQFEREKDSERERMMRLRCMEESGGRTEGQVVGQNLGEGGGGGNGGDQD